MTQFKTALLAGGMLAALGTHAAMAVPTISYEVFDNGVEIVTPTGAATTTSGQISVTSTSMPGFATAGLTVTGVNTVPTPRLNTNGSLTSSNPLVSAVETIRVLVTQTGLTSPTGTFNALNTLTLNNLNGSVVSSLSTYIDANGGAFAETTLIGSLTNGGGVATSNGNGSVTTVTVGSTFSETQELDATFTVASDGLSFSDQIAATTLPPTSTPEPASLALVGSALFGLGLIRRRRNRS